MDITRRIPALVAASLAASLCLAAQAVGSNGSGDHKTSLCHRTHSTSNPFVLITIDDSAVAAHVREHDDPFPRDGACPPTSAGWPPGPGDGPPDLLL